MDFKTRDMLMKSYFKILINFYDDCPYKFSAILTKEEEKSGNILETSYVLRNNIRAIAIIKVYHSDEEFLGVKKVVLIYRNTEKIFNSEDFQKLKRSINLIIVDNI